MAAALQTSLEIISGSAVTSTWDVHKNVISNFYAALAQSRVKEGVSPTNKANSEYFIWNKVFPIFWY